MKEASSKEKEYHYHYIKNIRNLLNKNDNLKTAIVLNFNRKVNNFKVEKSLNHLHGCVNRKWRTKRGWLKDNNRVKIFGFVEQGINQTHINIVVDRVSHCFNKVFDLIKMYWSKITNQSIKSAIYHNEIESKKRWLRYISKDYSDRNQNLLVYY